MVSLKDGVPLQERAKTRGRMDTSVYESVRDL